MMAATPPRITHWSELVTPYEETRAGFLKLALEKNRLATPHVEAAKTLQALASRAKEPIDLLTIQEVRSSLLAAAGFSDKAREHVPEALQLETIELFIDKFLLPSGPSFVDELVYRFLLTRGDTLGGQMRNLGGQLAQQQFTRKLISIFDIQGFEFLWFHRGIKKWVEGQAKDTTIELQANGLQWKTAQGSRALMFNAKPAVLGKNVDLCLLDVAQVSDKQTRAMIMAQASDSYIALGELKGGIDPAGADEHWKTANSAFGRIREAFGEVGKQPLLFLVAAAIEAAMAQEIYAQLDSGLLAYAANLTDQEQVVDLCNWLVHL
jgi:type II restriction enzyme